MRMRLFVSQDGSPGSPNPFRLFLSLAFFLNFVSAIFFAGPALPPTADTANLPHQNSTQSICNRLPKPLSCRRMLTISCKGTFSVSVSVSVSVVIVIVVVVIVIAIAIAIAIVIAIVHTVIFCC